MITSVGTYWFWIISSRQHNSKNKFFFIVSHIYHTINILFVQFTKAMIVKNIVILNIHLTAHLD